MAKAHFLETFVSAFLNIKENKQNQTKEATSKFCCQFGYENLLYDLLYIAEVTITIFSISCHSNTQKNLQKNK